ncbi:MAG: Gfo/Idh/MocA family oxidoreductase, partial [Lentisphaerota bacterium]
HWAVTANATPMIVAKSCHDMDLISWLIGRKCKTVSSFGSLTHFTSANAPKGAPARCVKGCPVGQTCPYNAMHYLGRHRDWLQYVYDHSKTANDAEILGWLAESPWGRCVYHCDNTAVDRQVVAMEFDGNATATFTMTAFDQGRNIEICGTKAVLRGGEFTKQNLDCDIIVRNHGSGDTSKYSVNPDVGGYAGHGGGDPGLVMNLHEEMSKKDPAQMRSSITQSLQSHLMGYAAEESRLTGKMVYLNEFLLKNS